MTDEKLDMLLREALQPAEQPPELFAQSSRKARPKWFGALAACACLVLCVGAYFALMPSMGGQSAETAAALPESAPEDVIMYSVVTDATAATQAAPKLEAEEICGYPTAVNAAVDAWRAENAPNETYEVLGDTERYYSIRTQSAEGEPLYLVIDKESMESVPFATLLERGDFDAGVEDENMFYVNQKQELILVGADCELNLGYVE